MRILLIIIALVLTTASLLPGQVPPAEPAGDVVIGSGSFSPIVKDLDKSLEFYRRSARSQRARGCDANSIRSRSRAC